LKKFNLIVLYFFLVVGGVFAQEGSGTIKGQITDETNGKHMFGVILTLKQNDIVKMRAKSDPNGKFAFYNVSAGKYNLELKYQQFQQVTVEVVVKSEGVVFLNNLKMGSKKSDKPIIIKPKEPLINPSGPSGSTFTKDDMQKMGARDAQSIAANSAGVTSQEGSGGLNIKGESSGSSTTYLDGVKTRISPTMPKATLEEVQVIVGGIPASYGDVTGGIISITTRGPSAKYFGSAEVVSSGVYVKGNDVNGYDGKVFGLDKFGYNLFEGMLAGPLVMKKDSAGRKLYPLLGFMVTANYTNQLDNSPIAYGGAYRVKKDVRDFLLANPLRVRPDGQIPVSNALFLTKDDFEKNPWRMNASSASFSSTGKIDVRLPKNMNLVFGSSYSYSYGKSYSRTSSLLNFANNGDYNSSNFNGYVKFSQRFYAKETTDSVKPFIKSASYNLMIDYSNNSGQSYDERYKYNAFNYGHVGTFTTTRIPTYAYDLANSTAYLNGYRDVSVDFVPDQNNMALAATTIQYYDIYKNQAQGYTDNITNIQNGGGLINGTTPQDVYGLWGNIGTPFGSMGKSSLEQFRVTGSGSVAIGDHAFTLGFEYERRFDRSWAVNPIALWTLARLKANSHINPVGVEVASTEITDGITKVTYKPINTSYASSNNGVYGGEKNQDVQSFFDYNLRNKLGLGGASSSHIDVLSLDPSLLSVNMFSQDELLNNGSSYISYYGYDISGNKVSGKTSINDYFTSFDQNNNYKRFVGAYQPTYVAGFIMDKFSIDKLVFNIGVRVDVFDANQPVLKDPYLLYQARTAGEVRELVKQNAQTYSWANVPSSVGDDYIVYVDDLNNPSQINGFRSGSQWYTANGNPTDKSSEVRGPGGITPWLLNPTDKEKNNITSSAFTNYKAQVNVMPRLAFSFPISNSAAFTAHYDILTIRPTNSITRFDPTDYLFLSTTSTPTINNPGLKPKQTIDYEVGFQQVLSENSSIKIAGFYREQRNDIQLVRVIDAYPSSYSTYGNIDFGTVKGMTVSYDLRRVNNLRLVANYTLQFAEGTGANSAITQNVTSIGYNFRYIFPYSYDIRHQLNIVADYRYSVGPGEKYKGPMLGNIELLKNTGLNITTNIYSGSPYTAQGGPATTQYVGMTGTVNGSRLPWTYRLDMVLDRDFQKEFKRGEGDNIKKKTLYFNVYVRATNLFNKLNLLGVYPGTGSWKDDGFLAAAQNQNSIQNQLNVQSYIDYYTMAIQNPGNLSMPRTVRLGVRVDF
jgi:hypothetical protein